MKRENGRTWSKLYPSATLSTTNLTHWHGTEARPAE